METVRESRGRAGTRRSETRSVGRASQHVHGLDEQRVGRTAGLLRLHVRGVVRLHAVEELLSALRVLDVLDADVHALLDVPVADDLVHDDAHSVWCDVVHDARAPVDRVR
jgi:hypothetical protein